MYVRNLAIFAAVALGVFLGGCSLDPEENPWLDTYIVGLGAEPAEVGSMVNEMQLDFAEIFEFEPLHIFENVTQGFQVVLPVGLEETLEESFDEIDYIIVDPTEPMQPPDPGDPPGDPNLGDDEVPEAIERIGGTAIEIVPLIDLTTVEVAVVDTGVDLDHPDLWVVAAYDAVGAAGGEDSGGDDLNGHGSHVAGTIGAVADGEGVAGVSPGVGIQAVRVLDSNGSGNIGDIIDGLEYVSTQENVRVVNMSLGGPSSTSPPQPLKDAIDALEEMGVVVCIAAGNDGDDTSGYIPAGYDSGIVVSAYDTSGGADNGYAYFSNYGDEVDIAAPGVDIYSTFPGGDYDTLSGTSMATPHVAGAAAAYIAENPTASAAEVIDALISAGEAGYNDQGGDHPEPLLNMTTLLQ